MATNTYVAIETKTVTSAVSAVTFTSIPQTYKDLIVVASPAGDTTRDLQIRLGNGSLDTASNYSTTAFWASTSTNGSNRNSSATYMYANYYAGITGTLGGNLRTYHFNNYSNTTTFKSVLMRSATPTLGSDALVGTWRSTAAINTISFFLLSGDIVAGSVFTLYGIESEGEIVTTAKATGGTITYGSDYTYHVFTSGGTFTPSQALTCDYLVVAGGGGGGSGVGSANNGGGGGAGGYRTAYAQAFANGTGYTVTVGSGGAADANGVNSSIIGGAISFASTGGGRGGYNSIVGNGGSGGGTSNTYATPGTGNAGSYTPAEGNNGSVWGGYWAGGGGGAALPGTPNGGGGDGIYTTLGPIPQYYAGGGGGGFNSYADRKGLPGLGGGGNGADYGGQWFGVAQAGTANTGGGGGGGASQGASIPGAAGGSGVVIIRYAS